MHDEVIFLEILSIGNSFTLDPHQWLHDMAESAGYDLECHNIAIGGCSLERHWECFKSNKPEYFYELNAKYLRDISFIEALTMQKYDVITLQQASHFSFKKETYVPYLENLYNEVKKLQPDAKIYIQQTWAYQDGCDREVFVKDFESNSEKMYEAVVETYNYAANLINVPLIRTGDFIQYLRRNLPEFNSKDGINITRDGFHLNFTYGRFAAGLIWYATLLGGDIDKVNVIPTDPEGIPANKEIIEKIKTAAKLFLKQNKI